ncbi:NAD(P)/FAD-dependent oxidoreductase [Enterococcus sp. CSURQ0835]|uniref:NAD(P)/FAD-dependent oxidoreductase n=1 Tax=Enterococcus sp. CSURQ0835 TaxID=2681394 RepID=UPI001358FA94|nr:NAD(P)/FAD-dependent oxidoreductase [Enterococcus sp. CSURQ0835]
MQTKFEVIVIGGGPAGMMSAINAATNGARVALIDKNRKLGKKLLLTGGGRCNVTNNRPVEDLIRHIPGNGRFLYSTFSQFDNQAIIEFFNSRNISLKEEDHGRMFPVTDRSKTIVDALEKELVALNVTLFKKTTVEKLLADTTKVLGVRTATGDLFAKSVVITTGGKTYPATGSTGDGFTFAKSCGHHVTPLYPTESPINLTDDVIKQKTLQGLALQDVTLSVLNEKGKAVTEHTLDLLFTHFGLSGPAALRCSSFVNQQLKQQTSVSLRLDCFPEKTKTELTAEITERVQQKKQLKNALPNFLPERLLHYFLTSVGIAEKTWPQVSQKELQTFVALCKDWHLHAKSTFGLEKSFVTGGGVELKEVDPKTLASKKKQGLFFAGEVLNINGYTGGYNITTALCTGYVAGMNAAYHAFD